jgi:anti-sigma factor RsiW
MNGCEKIRELLSLAVAGALDEEAEDRVARHASECAACAAEFEIWQGLARGLRRVPTPQPAPRVVERARVMAGKALAEEAERRRNRSVLIFVIALAWTMTLASWPVVRFLTGYLQLWLAIRTPETWHVFEGITVASWFATGVAAAVLAWHQRREGKVA